MDEISNRLTNVDQKIKNATEAVRREASSSPGLKQTVDELSRRSRNLMNALNSSPQLERQALIDKVDDLEECADRAKAAVRSDQQKNLIKDESFQAVIDAHNSLSDLKKQLH